MRAKNFGNLRFSFQHLIISLENLGKGDIDNSFH